MSALESNLLAISARFPDFAEELRALEPAPLEPFISRSGEPNARLRGQSLHSAYAPRAEARKLALATVAGSGSVAGSGAATGIEATHGRDSVVLAGFGLGYLAEELLSVARSAGIERVVAVERDLGLLRAALSLRDLRAALSDERLAFATGTQAAFKALDLERARQAWLAVTPSYATLFPALVEETAAMVRRFNARETVNARTLERFGPRWTANLARNAEMTVGHPGVELAAGLFEGLPALVVAAGPSLDEAAPRLRELARRAVVIAVDTALSACLRAGVEPDFVVVVDPQYWNSRHLDGCALGKGVLVTESAVWPSVFRLPRGGTLLCASLYPLGRLLDPPGRGELGAGGSVATTAWDFARVAGCRPVYMAGLDLSYPDKATHASGSWFERRALCAGTRLLPPATWSWNVYAEAGPRPVPDNSGGTVRTDGRMALYAWWFESRLARHPDTGTRNLSSRGMAIPGMPRARYEEALSSPDRRTEIDALMDGLRERSGGGREPSESARREARARLDGLLSKVEAARDAALRGREAAGRALRAEGRPAPDRTLSRVLAELDAADAALSRSEVRDVVGFLAPALGLIAAESGGGARGALERSMRLYDEIALAAGRVMDIVRRAR